MSSLAQRNWVCLGTEAMRDAHVDSMMPDSYEIQLSIARAAEKYGLKNVTWEMVEEKPKTHLLTETKKE